MESGVDPNSEDTSRVVVTNGGAKEFRGSVEHKDPLAPTLIPAPEGVPAKFWDDIKGELRTADLVKSYSELAKKLGVPKDPADEDQKDPADEDQKDPADEDQKDPADEDQKDPADEDEKDPADEDEKDPADEDEKDPKDAPALATAMEAAQVAYAETGELSEEAREPLKALGITDDQIDFYIAGVKSTEAALQSTAYKAAGSEEDFKAAVAWAAAGGQTPKQIMAFNAQTGDVETIGPAVIGLMAAFRSANPGEGKLLDAGHGSHGDVYTDMADFRKELADADMRRDLAARKKAVDKLRRSKKAKTITTARRQPFGN